MRVGSPTFKDSEKRRAHTEGLFYYIKLNTKIPRVPHIDPSARRRRIFGRHLAVVAKSLGKLFRKVYSGCPGSPGSAARHAILRGTKLDALIAVGFPEVGRRRFRR